MAKEKKGKYDKHIGKKHIEAVEKKEYISKEHLAELQQIVNAINNMQYNVGKLETQKHRLLHELAEGQDQIKLMQDKLKQSYGTFDVNVNDGKINWPKENVEKPKEDEK